MLDEFSEANRLTIISRIRERVAARPYPTARASELLEGIPLFLEQLGIALRLAQSSSVIDHEKIGATAALHGREVANASNGRIDVHDLPGKGCVFALDLPRFSTR